MIDQAFNFCGLITDAFFAETGYHRSLKCRSAFRQQKRALWPLVEALEMH